APSRRSRAISTVLASASTIWRRMSGVGPAAVRDNWGIKRLKAATSSSSTLLATRTSIPLAGLSAMAVWANARVSGLNDRVWRRLGSLDESQSGDAKGDVR